MLKVGKKIAIFYQISAILKFGFKKGKEGNSNIFQKKII